MSELLLTICVLALVAAIEGTRQLVRWSADRRAEELRRRLQSLSTDGADGSLLLRDRRMAKTRWLDELLRGLPLAQRMEKLLEQADSPFTVAQMISWSAFAACAAFVVAGVLGLGLFLAVSFAGGGVLIPTALLFVARDQRSRKLSEQLPDALDMLARSLRAGHAFTASFETVATEMPSPVAVEFGRAFEAQRLGLPVEQAIVEMTDRVPSNSDLKIFAVSAVIQRETGGNLAENLGSIADTIRARYRFYGKLRALTAEGRASGVILALLPIGMALLLKIINPPYLMPLVTPGPGQIALVFAVVSWIVGVVWLYRLTKVDL